MSVINGTTEYTGMEIAVIGMAGRFPGAKNLDEFWNNLKNGIESISFFPGIVMGKNEIHRGLLQHPYFVKAKGVLEDIEYFDPLLFGYSPEEAEKLNPQSRILFEVAWEALENAGYNSFSYKGVIGLFVIAGQSCCLFLENQSLKHNSGDTENNNFSQRIARRLNLKDCDLKLPPTCSNSLAAIHRACQSLLTGECHMALAGGVSVTLPAKTGYIYQEGKINSPDGHCRAFDISAKGTCAGDGSGIVVLKKLEDAAAAGDCIHAIIKGSALDIKNNGAGNRGTAIPSIDVQTELIERTLERARVNPDTIGYIETHGIGTLLSDAVEVEALTRACKTEKKGYCPIGSVKPNIGHLDAAAGAAGFIKIVLILKNKMVPPTLNFETPNPGISFLESPFYVNTQLVGVEKGKHPLRTSVSNFGAGGVNAHIILEEAPGKKHSGKGKPWKIIVLSAKTKTALNKGIENLGQYLQKNPGVNLADLAYTLQVGRKTFEHRAVMVCESIDQAIEALSNPTRGKVDIFFSKEPAAVLPDNPARDLKNGKVNDRAGKNHGNITANILGDNPGDYSRMRQISRLWGNGRHIDWSDFYMEERRYRLALPTYAYDRQAFAVNALEARPFRSRAIEQEDACVATGFPPIEPTAENANYPLSIAQQEFYLPGWQESGIRELHMTATAPLELHTPVEMKRLEKALLKLIKRHETLRTSFPLLNEKPVQRIHEKAEYELEYYDLTKADAREKIHRFITPPFDLAQAPPWRVSVLKEEEGKYLLIVDIHPLIADWTSINIFIRELIALYTDEELPPLKFRYRDYSQWQNTIWRGESARMKQQEEYWLKEFKEEIPLPYLPVDEENTGAADYPENSNPGENIVSFEIDIEETRVLKRITLEKNVTMYSLLLAASIIFLSKISSREEIVIGTLVECRRYAGLENIIGLFSNTLAVKSYPRENYPFTVFLKKVQRKLYEAFDNREYPFQYLVKHVKKSNTHHNPLFDVMFIYRKTGRNIKPDVFKGQTGPPIYDLTLAVEDAANSLQFNLEYNKKCFKQERVERYSRHIREVLSSLVENTNIRLKDITISHGVLDSRSDIPRMEFVF